GPAGDGADEPRIGCREATVERPHAVEAPRDLGAATAGDAARDQREREAARVAAGGLARGVEASAALAAFSRRRERRVHLLGPARRERGAAPTDGRAEHDRRAGAPPRPPPCHAP